MKNRLSLWLALAMLAVPSGIAAAKVESRCLPPEMPKTLFPTWVLRLPPVESQEISAPLHAPNARNGSAKAVTDLAGMAKEARAAIDLANDGKFREAAMAGGALLKMPSHWYGDYTWDYLANATAWSHIQTGSLKGAENAHLAAVARVVDSAVLQYHRLAAEMLGETGKSARQLKDYPAYRDEITNHLASHLANYERNIKMASQSPLAPARERCLKEAYDHLRVITAADPDKGNELARTSFRDAADGLIKVIAPALLAEARKARDALIQAYTDLLFERQWRTWNSGVTTLHNRVRHVKRVCRIHDYLARAKLANSNDADQIFRQAHRLLFADDGTRLVWQELGDMIVLNGITQKDLRRKVPWQETKIAPFGRVAGSEPPPQVGWETMGTMDGKMQGMNGDGFNKMDDGGFKNMRGDGFKNMGGDGFKKMGGDGFKPFR